MKETYQLQMDYHFEMSIFKSIWIATKIDVQLFIYHINNFIKRIHILFTALLPLRSINLSWALQ